MEIGGKNINQPIKYLVRSVILSTPDRSEYRAKISQVNLNVDSGQVTVILLQLS